MRLARVEGAARSLEGICAIRREQGIWRRLDWEVWSRGTEAGSEEEGEGEVEALVVGMGEVEVRAA